MEKIKIIALCGKAGSGKDTLLQEVLTAYPGRFHEIVSCTTRAPRDYEKDGVHYFFLSTEEFEQKLLDGDLLEATVFNDWHYGTLKSTLAADKTNIGVFNPEGVMCLKENSSIDLEVIYITCPDKIRLIRQLNREENPSISELFRRYKTDEEDFLFFEEDVNPIIFENFLPEDRARFSEFIGQIC